MYSAATAIIRYIYIRSSLQPNVQSAIKRNAFILKSILIVEALGCCTLLNLYILQYGKSGTEKSSLLLYQTCLDPFKSSFTISFLEVIPLNKALLQIANICDIFCNLAIYKHLDKESQNILQKDQLKIRRRNLVSAKVGIYSLALIIINWLILSILYSIPIDLGNSFLYWTLSKWPCIYFSGIRSFISRMLHDVYICISIPLVVMYNSSIVMNKVRQRIYNIYGSNHVQSFHV